MWRFRRRLSPREFAEEMRAHIELEADRLRGEGRSEREAQAEARRAFGNMRLSEERYYESSRVMWAEHFRQDLLYTWRQMRHGKAFTAIAAGTMALGIGSAAAVFSMVQATLLRPLPYNHAERIVSIQDRRLVGQSTGGLVAVPRFFDVSARSRSFEALTFFYFDEPTVIDGKSAPAALRGVGTGAEFWKTLGIAPMLGRTFSAAENARNGPVAAVLSFDAWQRYFGGDTGILHRLVRIDGKGASIVGVLPPGAGYPNRIEIWTPAQFDPADWRGYRGDGTRFVNVLGRMRPGVEVAQAAGELDEIGGRLRKEHPEDDGHWTFASEPLRENLYGPVKPALLVLLGASGLLLAIASINVANLLLSRGTARLREVALRRALGASHGRIARQFLLESTVLSLMGGGAGLAIAGAAVRLARAALPGRLGSAGAEIDTPVIALMAALSVLTGILCGLAPALTQVRTDLNGLLKAGEARMGGSGGGRLRGAFVTAEVALSVVLLVGACLIAESYRNLIRTPFGFRTEQVTTFDIKLPWMGDVAVSERFYRELQRRVAALPGVAAVGQISALPTADWHLRSNFDVDWRARTAHGDAVNAEIRSIAGDYLRVMSIPLLSGRALREEDLRVKHPPVLVNEEFVRRYAPAQSPLGRSLINAIGSFEIVGVIGNVRGTAGSVAAPAGPEVYFPADGGAVGRTIVVSSRLPAERLSNAIREQVRGIDPGQAVRDFSTLERHVDQAVGQPRFQMILLGAFAAIALLLACVGVFGVVSYAVAQRTVEIGIRMALGATPLGVSGLFLRRGLSAALAGLALGGGASLWVTRLVESQLYGVSARSPEAFGAAAVLLVAAVLAATLGPCLRAASTNPVDALRRD